MDVDRFLLYRKPINSNHEQLQQLQKDAWYAYA